MPVSRTLYANVAARTDEVQHLGRLKLISDDGGGLDIPQPRQRALLAVPLLHANQEMSVSRLAQSLGDEDGPAVTPGALRTKVWSLRKLLAPARRLHTGIPRIPAGGAPGRVGRQ